MGPRASLNRCGKSYPHRDSIPGPSSLYPVAIPTSLPGPITQDGQWKLTDTATEAFLTGTVGFASSDIQELDP